MVLSLIHPAPACRGDGVATITSLCAVLEKLSMLRRNSSENHINDNVLFSRLLRPLDEFLSLVSKIRSYVWVGSANKLLQ